MTARLRVAFVAIAFSAAGAGILAQTATKVPLAGTVRDLYTRRGYLEGVTIKITSRRTGETVTLVTGKDGSFSLPAVDPGVYTIAVAKAGYNSLVDSNYCVVTGKPARFDVAIGPDRGSRAAPPQPGPDPPIVYTPVPTPSTAVLTADEIQEAMAFGRANPTLQAPELKDSGRLIRRRTAALWTPFWRVATMTQVAAATTRTFVAGEIPTAFIQKHAWIVAAPAVHYAYSSDMDSPQYFAPVARIVIRREGAPARDDITPVWRMHLNTVCDVEAMESVLGRQFPRAATIAVFPLDAIRPGSTILFTYSTNASLRDGWRGISVGREVRRVVIGDDDVKNWR